MSLLNQLQESSFLKINRSPDFDHFRSIEELCEARSIPVDCKGFAASFASLRLKSCSVYLQQTFPRILQARYHVTGAMVAFPMNDAASLTLNGVTSSERTLIFVKGRVACEIFEPQSNLFGVVHVDCIEDRGWPGEADSARLIAIQPALMEALQALTLKVLTLASQSPALLLQPQMIECIEESLLQAVDLAMASASPLCEGKGLSLTHYLTLVRKFDDFLAANAGKTVYSADVARQLGVSVRTLHNAVVAIRGMSMHRYTRLRRLWDVRQRLVRMPPPQSIRAVALLNGFWHMGEFAALYRELFGQSPQQSLASVRKQADDLS
ncbi:MAG: helix-turn-helix domain-containing protein [bacterium]|nr:helix-turn-helix domain-containing protein [bacterium]